MYDFIHRYGDKGYELGIQHYIKEGILSDSLQRNIEDIIKRCF